MIIDSTIFVNFTNTLYYRFIGNLVQLPTYEEAMRTKSIVFSGASMAFQEDNNVNLHAISHI